MKAKEYIRLGRISIKSRKKSTRNTVTGIAFGLILLIPVIFFALAFYVDLLHEVNKTHNIASFAVPFVQNKSAIVIENSSEFVFGAGDRAALMEREEKEVEEALRFEYYDMHTDEAHLIVGERSYGLSYLRNYNQLLPRDGISVNANVKVVKDAYMSRGMESDLENNGAKLFIAGEGFTGAAGEVVISKALADAFNLDPQSAIGQTFTLNVQAMFATASSADDIYEGYYLDNDSNPDNRFSPLNEANNYTANAITGFRIVGVISDEYYRLNTITRGDAHIWLPNAAVYDANGVNAYAPAMRGYTREQVQPDGMSWQYDYAVVTYSSTALNEIAARAAQEGKFFPLIPAFTYGTTSGSYLYRVRYLAESPIETVLFQCKNYNAADSFNNLISARHETAVEGVENYSDAGYAPESFNSVHLLNTVGGYLMIVMFTFGGIIFFATLLNLYNSVNYSVEVRKNYMGMLRAIGARTNVIPKLYFVEILLIFARSLPWVLLFGGGISVGLKFGFDALFKGDAASLLGAALHLNFAYFFLALALVFVLIFLIATLFSVVSCRTITRKGIMEVLSDDK